MNIVSKLTLRHLKENKGRTVVTTLGVCVSVAMITAVFVAIASFLNLFADMSILVNGDSVAEIFELTPNQIEKLKADNRIDTVGISDTRVISYQVEKRKSDRTGTGTMLVSDKNNSKLIFTGRYDGVIPANSKEIAVEQEFIEKNNLDWKLGDVVSIPTGDRTVDNGKSVLPGGSYQTEEKFIFSENKKFKITAIMHNNYATVQNYDIICGFGDDEIFGTATARIKLKELNSNSLNVVYDIVDGLGLGEETEKPAINGSLLECYFAYEDGSTFASLLPMVITILIIIVIASVILIYNAFAMSLSERVRYLGMLASIGATKKQKRLSIYSEGIILGAIGIPVGIGAGILGIGITLKILGRDIIESGVIRGIEDSTVSMGVAVPIWTIVCIVILSALTIFISSFIPARKASKVTPIDAIRQRKDIKLKSKKLKSPQIIRLIFGYEGELAHKNIKRNGGKARVITVSIALSIILFLSCNYFCQLFSNSTYSEKLPYQVQIMIERTGTVEDGQVKDNTSVVPYEEKAKISSKLDNVNDIDDYYSISFIHYIIESGEEQSSELKDLFGSENLTNQYKNLFSKKNHLYINFLDDKKFNKLCKNNNINYENYYGSESKGLIMNNFEHEETGSKVFNDGVVGKKLNYLDIENLTISNLVEYDKNNSICNLNPPNSISIYIPYSTYYNNLNDKGKNNLDEMVGYNVGIETKQHKKVAEEIETIIDDMGIESKGCYLYVFDIEENMQAMNTIMFVMQVFIYGFIILIILITVANIINTISTGIMSRRKEFAMLKSVGITPKGFNKMIMLESALYGIRALIFALPISLIINYMMNHSLGQDTIPFMIDWKLYLVVIALVFVLIGLTMLYSMHKIKGDNIIETIKQESD